MIVTERQLIEQIQDWVNCADADELSRLAGELLGGNCIWNTKEYIKKSQYCTENLYSFEPDKNYYGAFDKYQDENIILEPFEKSKQKLKPKST